MPNKVVAYSCSFKCGRNVLTQKASMIKHEKLCFRNPINKACITCKNFDYFEDHNGMDEPYKEDFIIRQCLVGIDNTLKLKHHCEKYNEKSKR